MITRRVVPLALALALVAAVAHVPATPTASACSCDMAAPTRASVSDLLDWADAVVIGRVERASGSTARVLVESRYKGDVPHRIAVVQRRHSAMCGYDTPLAGSRHFLALTRLGAWSYEAGLCSSFRVASWDDESTAMPENHRRFLAVLDEVAPPEVIREQTPLSEPSPSLNWRRIWLLIGIAFAVTAGFYALYRSDKDSGGAGRA
jgi:hypothetical protein